MVSHDGRVVQLLADPTTRSILSSVADAAGALSVAELADRIESAESRDPEMLAVSLHHKYLPQLDEAGLLAYDPADNRVSSGTGAFDDAQWMDDGVLANVFRQIDVGTGSDDRPVERLEGRERVYDYGREMAERAADELFLIYASDELLDEACLPHARRAIDRGVAFHAGTKNCEAREFFSTHLPEATIWEPQLDWLYDPTGYPTVSRLIVADRDHVLVGLWDETAAGTKREVALVGEGRANPFVVLIRELLGPRLDHLDYQSDDFLGSLTS
ncbi:hypothetical protein Halru_0291 [Halovivax ruber XH-70]|uniref:DUF7344 domain-containing protein n=1 Tax=Halovivax ruber (strain DSM 18193 / JCM 13892 / XH-70) TaxID=797302 RepID=L0IAG4_HALRX|nr:hypothetical protein [Halovivax ruber]AGB14937.1 hypothetical protein Halru_0291 [Halovivax ruber XH-70]